MKKYITNIIAFAVILASLQGCNDDEGFFGDEVFNALGNFPYVSIQDRNEEFDFNPATGNNFWSFELTPEDDGNRVRIVYSTQDPNIIDHQVTVGTPDGFNVPPADSVVLTTITRDQFPIELTFTKEQIANALGLSIDELNGLSGVAFGGSSRDEDGNVIDDPSGENFEGFIRFERHAYYYEWPF